VAKISNETKITLTIVIALVVAFFGYRLMRDLPLFQQSQVVYTHFEQVSGLTTGSYIYINGVKVGSIKKIELIARDSVEVSLGFNVGIEINRGSVAYLESTGLLGDKAINIQEGSSDRIVPGGGVALLRTAHVLSSLKAENPDQKVGFDIVRRAIEAPLRTIAHNAGAEGSIVVQKVLEGKPV
jgi:ABC-type transporter Mla subunit MlaD